MASSSPQTSETDSAFWRAYREVTQKLQKKYVFKKPPYAEVREQYKELLNQARKKDTCPEYEAICQLAIARCDEAQAYGISPSQGQDLRFENGPSSSAASVAAAAAAANIVAALEDNNSLPIGVLGALMSGEAVARRSASARKFFQSQQLYSRLSVLLLPLHLPLPFSSIAVQNFLLAARDLQERQDISPAASVLSELASFLKTDGAVIEASEYFAQSANMFVSAGARTSALRCLHSAIECCIESKSFRQAIKHVRRLLDLQSQITMSEQTRSLSLKRNLQHPQEDFADEAETDEFFAHILLLLLNSLTRDFSKAHQSLGELKVLATTSSSETFDSSKIVRCPPSDLLASFFDLVVAIEEHDLTSVIELSQELGIYLQSVHRLLLDLIIEDLSVFESHEGFF